LLFDVKPEEFRRETLRDLRYLVAGMDALNEAMHLLGDAIRDMDHNAQRAARETLDGLRTLSGQLDHTNYLLGALVVTQQEILRVLQAPLATEAAELQRRAVSAAGRGLWTEAINDYDRSIAINWDQPTAHLGRGLAILGKAGGSREAVASYAEAAESFEKAARYAISSAPSLSVQGVQHAVVVNDHLGRQGKATEVLRWATQALPGSPEIAFSAALRFRSADLLQRAVRLDPTLAADLAWQSLPFAAAVVAALLTEQKAAIHTAIQAMADARQYGSVPQVRTGRVTGCLDALDTLRELSPKLLTVRGVVGQPSREERQLTDAMQADIGRMNQLNGKMSQIQRNKLPWGTWLGGALLAAFITPSIAGFVQAWRHGHEAADAVLIPTFVVTLIVLGVALPLLVTMTRNVRINRHQAGKRAAEERRETRQRQAGELATRRQTVVDKLTRTADAVTRLATRSPEAYP
jgi:tetratricopeptide (TPR) repeat protein